MLASAGMFLDTDDSEPVTRRELPVLTSGPLLPAIAVPRFAYCVDITYREPVYALYSGTERLYSGTFLVVAADERDATAQAMARFEAAAAASGVGWSRVIVGVVCRAG